MRQSQKFARHGSIRLKENLWFVPAPQLKFRMTKKGKMRAKKVHDNSEL
jgi:hypothetical protein